MTEHEAIQEVLRKEQARRQAEADRRNPLKALRRDVRAALRQAAALEQRLSSLNLRELR